MAQTQAANDIKLSLTYHPAQAAIFDHPAKVKVIVKGRRFGLTRGYANHAIESMLGGIDSILWVDTINSNIDRYVERYFYPVLRNLPSQYWTWRQQKKELTIFDSKLDFRSADQPERIEGFGYKLIVLNEAGIILNDRYLWENAILPMTLDFNPDIYIGGTPKGKNLFWDLATKAQDDQDPKYKNWKHFHFTSYDNPFISKEEIDVLAADLPEIVKQQEILAEFLDDASSVFRNVSAAIDPAMAPLQAPEPGRTYFMGVDLAKHVDFTVIDVLDDTGRQVHFKRLNQLDWNYQKQLITEVAQLFQAKVCLDSTGIGDPIFEDLSMRSRKDGLDISGYKFTSDSKKKLIESLMLAFEGQKIRLLPERVQENELKEFGYEITASGVKYSAPEGHHDDCVIALALANWARIHAVVRHMHFI
jgi:phage FluMu gp28-like protein